jgi:hypothetical protein
MASDVTICNLALMRIGVSQPIADLSEQTTAAILANTIFADTRDLVLRSAHWGFARKVAALALVAEDPTDDWGFSYRYPADAVDIRKIRSGLRRVDPRDERVSYELSSDGSGLLIYTDQEDAVAEYTWRVTTVEWYPPDFVSALAWRLAVDLAMALAPSTLGSAMRDKAEQYYRAAIIDAKAASLNEEAPDDAPPSEFIRARD